MTICPMRRPTMKASELLAALENIVGQMQFERGGSRGALTADDSLLLIQALITRIKDEGIERKEPKLLAKGWATARQGWQFKVNTHKTLESDIPVAIIALDAEEAHDEP